MPNKPLSDFTTVGRVGAAYGVKGWVKLISFADPLENILSYPRFTISEGGALREIELDQGRPQGKGFVGHIKGCDDRDKTRDYTGKELMIEKSLLPELSEESFYWYELEGLKVVTLSGDDLGYVHHLIETGANDVLVVKPNSDSVDDKERLIPYLKDQVIDNVDLKQQLIKVNWEKDYLQE